MDPGKHILFGLVAWFCLGTGLGQERTKSSYAPVVPKEAFSATRSRMRAEKLAVMKRQKDLLQDRYDLKNDPAPGVTMARGKPVQRGIRVKLTPGTSWEKLAALTPEEIHGGDFFPPGFLPQFQIDEIKKQEGRDLTRFDLDFDLPDQFLPEFPAPIFLTTRPDLGDVSRGKLVTSDNFFELPEEELDRIKARFERLARSARKESNASQTEFTSREGARLAERDSPPESISGQ